jgi:hypothetical protein
VRGDERRIDKLRTSMQTRAYLITALVLTAVAQFMGAMQGVSPGLFNALFLDRVSPKCHTLTQTAIG